MFPQIIRTVAVALALGVVASSATAQRGTSTDGLLREFALVPAPRGYETALSDAIRAHLPGATRDRAGNVVLTGPGAGSSRLVACALDEPGWVVGGIRADGYLTIRPLPGTAPRGMDAQLEGQRVVLLGTSGAVPGVVGVRSVHLTRGRSDPAAPFSFDQAFVDVGARTDAEARSLGLRETTPVVLDHRLHEYADRISAPFIGNKAACAALLDAALAAPGSRPVTVAFVVEQGLSQRGLRTVAATLGPFEETLIVSSAEGDRPVAMDSVASRERGLGQVIRLSVRTWFAGSPVESIRAADVLALRNAIVKWMEARP